MQHSENDNSEEPSLTPAKTFEEFLRTILPQTIPDDSVLFWEMANVVPKRSGLPFTVWLSPRMASQDARVIAEIDHIYTEVSVGPPIKIKSGAPMSGHNFKLLKRWIKVNFETIIAYWDRRIIDAGEIYDVLVPFDTTRIQLKKAEAFLANIRETHPLHQAAAEHGFEHVRSKSTSGGSEMNSRHQYLDNHGTLLNIMHYNGGTQYMLARQVEQAFPDYWRLPAKASPDQLHKDIAALRLANRRRLTPRRKK